jgi:hypothetical protein
VTGAGAQVKPSLYCAGRMAVARSPEVGEVEKIATISLILFLAAVLVALGITIASVAIAVRILAVAVVTPILALAITFLIFELQGRARGFVGASVLGILGVGLRLAISTQPQLEVGGGLPEWVSALYIGLGIVLIGTSLWAYVEIQNPR